MPEWKEDTLPSLICKDSSDVWPIGFTFFKSNWDVGLIIAESKEKIRFTQNPICQRRRHRRLEYAVMIVVGNKWILLSSNVLRSGDLPKARMVDAKSSEIEEKSRDPSSLCKTNFRICGTRWRISEMRVPFIDFSRCFLRLRCVKVCTDAAMSLIFRICFKAVARSSKGCALS